MARHRPNPKETLLDAATEVAIREGVARLTFDAVAAEAGVSKGGVLHHFSNKDQLVEALVERAAQGWLECYMDAYERTSEGPGRMARAILHECLLGGETWAEPLRRRFSAVLTALAHNPALVRSMRETWSEIDLRLRNDGLPPGVGEIIGSAIDGIWLNWALHFCEVDQAFLKQRHDVPKALLDRALQEAAETPPPRRKTAKPAAGK